MVELCCPSASSLSEDALMAAEEQRTPADVRRGGTFDSTDSSRSAVLAVPSTPAERVRWPKPVPSVVGMYPPSFQRGSYVPRDIQKFCFPDDDVIVPKMLQTPLACISQAATGCVPALYPLRAVSMPPPLLTCGLTVCCGRGSVRGVRVGWECVQLARDLVASLRPRLRFPFDFVLRVHVVVHIAQRGVCVHEHDAGSEVVRLLSAIP